MSRATTKMIVEIERLEKLTNDGLKDVLALKRGLDKTREQHRNDQLRIVQAEGQVAELQANLKACQSISVAQEHDRKCLRAELERLETGVQYLEAVITDRGRELEAKSTRIAELQSMCETQVNAKCNLGRKLRQARGALAQTLAECERQNKVILKLRKGD